MITQIGARSFSSFRRWTGCAAIAATWTMLTGGAHALTIVPSFDSSITSLRNAAAVETSINDAIRVFERDFKSQTKLEVAFGWGEIAGSALPGGTAADSEAYIYTGFNYAELKSDIAQAARTNPTDAGLAKASAQMGASAPAGMTSFAITTAQAQALGLAPPAATGLDGYVGFDSALTYNFNPAGATPAGAYDLEALAEHEISEVMGRISGLFTARPAFETPLDLLRYSAPGRVASGYTTAAYFSLDGGRTDLGAFDTTGGGDRGDWQNVAGSNDAFDTSASSGVNMALSGADLTVMDALGWNAAINPRGWSAASISSSHGSSMIGDLPEPSSWSVMLIGLGALGAGARRTRLRRRAAA